MKSKQDLVPLLILVIGLCASSIAHARMGGIRFPPIKIPEPNRLAPVWDASKKEARCSGVAVPPDKCIEGQNKAVADCGLNRTEQKYMRDNGILPMCMSGQVLAVCSCGCFDAGTAIAVDSRSGVEWQAIETITRDQRVVSLSDESTLSSLEYRLSDLRSVVKGPESIPLYEIQVADGRKIALSQNHGVLLADGSMTTAKELQVGQELVGQAGDPLTIAAIVRRPARDGNVYNLLTDRDSKAGHLILANGFVVGDLMWQNSYADELGAVALRQ